MVTGKLRGAALILAVVMLMSFFTAAIAEADEEPHQHNSKSGAYYWHCTPNEETVTGDDLTCGKEAHEHTEDCKTYTCTPEVCTLEEHTHDESCFPCVPHTHSDSCRTCTKHVHTAACYSCQEHVHSAACYSSCKKHEHTNGCCTNKDPNHKRGKGCTYDGSKCAAHTHPGDPTLYQGKGCGGLKCKTHTHPGDATLYSGKSCPGTTCVTHKHGCTLYDGSECSYDGSNCKNTHVHEDGTRYNGSTCNMCTKTEHTHGDGHCNIPEHVHGPDCPFTYTCGQEEHVHNEDCYKYTKVTWTCSKELITRSLTLEKVWIHNENTDIPGSVQLQISSDYGGFAKIITLTDEQGWSHCETGLRKYHDDGETQVSYSVREIDVPANYTSTVTPLYGCGPVPMSSAAVPSGDEGAVCGFRVTNEYFKESVPRQSRNVLIEYVELDDPGVHVADSFEATLLKGTPYDYTALSTRNDIEGYSYVKHEGSSISSSVPGIQSDLHIIVYYSANVIITPEPSTPLTSPDITDPPAETTDPPAEVTDPPAPVTSPEPTKKPVVIKDPDTPKGGTPKTGDGTDLAALWIMLAVSLLGVGSGIVSRRVRRKEDRQ